MTPKFLIGSTYFSKPGDGMRWFYDLWVANTVQFTSADQPIIVIGTGAQPESTYANVQIIKADGDLGHCTSIIDEGKPWFMPACPSGWMALAWLAYLSEADFIYKEQDCLAFGDWPEKIYSELGSRKVMCGYSQMFGAATSLFLVRHEFIPTFVRDYLAQGPENNHARLPERKFMRLIQQWPEHYGQYTFGYDKDRPLKITDKVFSVQKLTPFELFEIKSKGLIASCDGMPDTRLFSNHE